jgi:hypothetical protein
LAEESGAAGEQDGLRWCVDPLDGTTNFAHGYPFFATSIGLTFRQTPVLGAIAVPFLGEVYWGAPGLGAFCNEQAINVSSCQQLEDSLLVTGFAYDRHTRLDNNYAEFCWFTHRTRGVRRGGAAAVDLAFVAAGRQDGYWERGLSPWDLAAGCRLGGDRWRPYQWISRRCISTQQWPSRRRWSAAPSSNCEWSCPGDALKRIRLRCARGHGHGILITRRVIRQWRCNLPLAQGI